MFTLSKVIPNLIFLGGLAFGVILIIIFRNKLQGSFTQKTFTVFGILAVLSSVLCVISVFALTGAEKYENFVGASSYQVTPIPTMSNEVGYVNLCVPWSEIKQTDVGLQGCVVGQIKHREDIGTSQKIVFSDSLDGFYFWITDPQYTRTTYLGRCVYVLGEIKSDGSTLYIDAKSHPTDCATLESFRKEVLSIYPYGYELSR